jgi:hypothetical protein
MSNKSYIVLLKSIVIGFGILCLKSEVRSQCPTYNILLETQAQVDSFQFNYPNCTEILTGRAIHIRGMDIHNLHGLSVLKKIYGLTIDSTSIVKLDSLQNITDLAEIILSNNPLLTNISAIGHITKLRFSFDLINNDAMVDLAGLSFDTLGYCHIKNNDALICLHGLENLTYMMDRIEIESNPSLRDLNGLSSLTGAYTQFRIVNNDRIKNLEGLENLLYVGYHFVISQNDSLQSLAGLEHVRILDQRIEYFYIVNNLQLDSCHIAPMCEFIADGGIVRFGNNAQGCNSVHEVWDLCMAVDVAEPGSESDIIVYPNPTHGLLYVNYTDSVHPDHLTIYNSLGMEVFQEHQHVGPIDITHLPNGLYILKFSLNESIKVATVVKF